MNGKLASLAVQNDCEMQWYVVNTNPRCEDRAARGLREMGVTVFLPTYGVKVRRRFGKPGRQVIYPLLTGYLFVELPLEDVDWFAVRRVDGVRKVLGLRQDVETLRPKVIGVGAAEVMEFMRLCAMGAFSPPDPDRRPFQPKDRVFVRSGPFRGLVCHFDDYTGAKSARLLVSIFGRLTPVDIGLDEILAA